MHILPIILYKEVNECLQHDNYDRGPLWALPAQTPVNPDQIKLFCSVLNYVMHLGEKKKKKKKDSFPNREFTKGERFLGALGGPWGMAGAGVLKLTPAQMKTENLSWCWGVWPWGCNHWGLLLALPCLSPPSGAAEGWCCRKRSGLPFCLPAVNTQCQPLHTRAPLSSAKGPLFS